MEAMTDEDDVETPARPELVRSELSEARKRRNDSRRTEILSLLMAGLSYETIAERQGITSREVGYIVERAMKEQPAGNDVALRRSVENARLDRAQAAIWTRVLEGDNKAIDSFLRISQRRSRLNGLDAPLQIELSAHVRIEMEQALAELQQVVLGEVVHSEYLGEAESASFE